MTSATNATLSPHRAAALRETANRLRRHALTMTAKAGSGHPTSALSCAELVAVLFFEHLRYDLARPDNPANDRFVLSKGHASPILWGVLAEAGAFPIESLEDYRTIGSDLEGHPTPRSPWVDVATGSLGQGLSIATGMALASRMRGSSRRVFCLMGDAEIAEGSVWEAAAAAAHERLGHLVAIVDVNRLGQSGPTRLGHDLDAIGRRFAAFGWRTAKIDGHDVEAIAESINLALTGGPGPMVVLARTLKGKGVSSVEDREGFHGKPLTGEALERALEEVGARFPPDPPLRIRTPDTTAAGFLPDAEPAKLPPPSWHPGTEVATRQAFGTAIRKLGQRLRKLIVLDGDVKNSTHTEEFAKAFPSRFVEAHIAEQSMIGMAVGLAASGYIPVAATFAAFLTRAHDFLRMASVSGVQMIVCGSHAGISIGEDGPSQMGLEDVAMMRALHGSAVLCPCDAVSTEHLVRLAVDRPGITYLRTLRLPTRVLYEPETEFRIGGSRVVAGQPGDRVTIIAAGATVHEAISAREVLAEEGIEAVVVDAYSIKPLDEGRVRDIAQRSDVVLTVEDHRPEGGLGEAVAAALAGTKRPVRIIAVRGLPRSGSPEALHDAYGISADAIAAAVREMTARPVLQQRSARPSPDDRSRA